VLWMIVASLLAIVTCGLHESYGTMLCIALATGTLAAYWMQSENRTAWLVVLIAAVVGIGIVAGAPGNRVRMSHDGPKHARLQNLAGNKPAFPPLSLKAQGSEPRDKSRSRYRSALRQL